MQNNSSGLHSRTWLRVAFQLSACLLIGFAFFVAQAQPTHRNVLSAAVPASRTTPIALGGEASGITTPVASSIASTATTAPRVARDTPTPSRTLAPGNKKPSPFASTPVLPSQTQALQPRQVVKLPRLAQVDEYTVALYRFDSQIGNQVIDETGHYTGTLHGGATITTTGLFGGALSVDGAGSYLRTGYLGQLPRGTIEAFVDFSTGCIVQTMPSLLSAGGEFGSQQDVLKVTQVWGIYLASEIYASPDNVWYWADSGINPCRYLAVKSMDIWPYEAWRFHHVAITWGERGMEFWVDGVLHGVGVNNPVPPPNYFDFRCNPQMQVGATPWPPNERYPVCKTPVIGRPQDGSYMRGLAPYSTFLIGCDSSGSCFNGRIDELRISNIQRTFEWTIVPTSTPTPSQTPDRISAEYPVDSATLGLYHFTDTDPSGRYVKEEVTQWYNAALRGNAAIVSGGRFGNGVSFDGNGSHVDTGHLGNPSTGVIEAWFNLAAPSSSFTIIHAGGTMDSNVNRLFLGANGGHIAFGMTYPGDPWTPPWARLESDVDPALLVGSWHHIAGTWGNRGYELWLDGQLCMTRFYDAPMPNPIETFLIGCDSQGRCMHGIVDEVRLSNIQRTYSPAGLGFVRSPAFATRYLPTSTPRVSAQSPADTYQFYLPFVISAPTPILCHPYRIE